MADSTRRRRGRPARITDFPSPHWVRCPKCGADVLEPCRFPSGQPVLPHGARLRIVRWSRERFDKMRATLWEQIHSYVEAESTAKELAAFRKMTFLRPAEKR
jgi:hypothetical protein